MRVKNVFTTPFGIHVRAALHPLTGEVVYGNEACEISSGAARIASELNAFGWDLGEEAQTRKALEEVRAGVRPVEVRIGVGPLLGPLPVRVIPYAFYACRAMQDARLLTGRIDRIALFSSAPKSRLNDPEGVRASLAALAGAIAALQGPSGPPIRLSEASPLREVPALPVRLSTALQGWLDGREERYAETARPDLNYGFEHASPSMFGDLGPADAFRVTIGGSNEGRFWAIRTAVRDELRRAGFPTVPAVAFIIGSLRVPWYSPTEMEPKFFNTSSEEDAVRELEIAANPDRGGNAGLRREAKAFRALMGKGLYETVRSHILGVPV